MQAPLPSLREPRLGEKAITTSENIPEPAVPFLGEKPLDDRSAY
jgi:hypothetical protein